jgi:WD40 repeat protein
VQACAQRTYLGELEDLGKFPSKLKEVSGLQVTEDGKIWVIEDSGNKDQIYRVNNDGKILESLKVDHAKNKDWEDLTMDVDGNLYIGDFGNNGNGREDLVIYKVSNDEMDKKKPNADKIEFNYPQQKDFPPQKDSLYFDTEGFFHLNDHLYIFTKNRTRPYSGNTLIYRVPDKEGEYEAEFLGSLFLCADQHHCSVTSADISPNGNTIALLSYGFVFLLTDFSVPDLTKASIKIIDLKTDTQVESICFANNNTLLIADEENRFGGRKLYELKLD